MFQHFFPLLRGQSGYSYSPAARQVVAALQNVVVLGSLWHGCPLFTMGNCEPDDDCPLITSEYILTSSWLLWNGTAARSNCSSAPDKWGGLNRLWQMEGRNYVAGYLAQHVKVFCNDCRSVLTSLDSGSGVQFHQSEGEYWDKPKAQHSWCNWTTERCRCSK